MSARKRRKRRSVGYADIELNIMPFVDVFSMLNTFLLFSAVFFSLGMFEVQLPFLSNSPDIKDKPERSIEVKVTVKKSEIELETSFSLPPTNRNEEKFELTERGLSELHRKLVGLRQRNVDAKRLTLYCDDEVIYEDLTKVLDAVKSRYESDPALFVVDEKTGQRIETRNVLFPQVVMGSVIL